MIRNKLLRKKVAERDSGVCAICGRYDSKWQADHRLALSMGGRDDLDNLQTLCRLHHGEKTVSEAAPRAKANRLRERAELTRKRRTINA
jgi:5-methylcytosine-specific restriction protein A